MNDNILKNKSRIQQTVDRSPTIVVNPEQKWINLVSKQTAGHESEEYKLAERHQNGIIMRITYSVFHIFSTMTSMVFYLSVAFFYRIVNFVKNSVDFPKREYITIFQDSDQFWHHEDIDENHADKYRSNLREQ